MNPGRSLGPAIVLGDWTAWWAYLLGPIAGAVVAGGFAFVLRGAGGGHSGRDAAEGTLGETWRTGPIANGPTALPPETSLAPPDGGGTRTPT
jgi:aquaporin Z